MANPCSKNEERNHHNNVNSSNSTTAESSFMRHNAGTAIDWDFKEQAILVAGLARYSSDPSILRYVKIARHLSEKTVRDVAQRSKWLYNKENSKRRKENHNGLVRARVENKVNSTSASHSFVTSPPLISEEHKIAYDLLKKNEQLFNQISANLTSPSLNIRDNLNLFTESLEIFTTLITNLNKNACEPMKRMPPLPVKLNEDLYQAVLPPLNLPDLQNYSPHFLPHHC